MPNTLNETLGMTATLTVFEFEAAARAEFANIAEWPLAQILEILDERTCPYCEAVDGMILDRSAPDYEKWAARPHINCRRILAYINASEESWNEEGELVPTQPNFVPPPQELIEQHAHFIVDPEKYSPIRIPAQPEPRDFVFRRIKDPESGQMVSVLTWNTRMREIEGLRPGTIQQDIMGGLPHEPWYPSARIEHALRSGAISQAEEIGVGVTNPLRARAGSYNVCYKPEPPAGDPNAEWWSPPNEEAAYLIDQELNLGLVPPTAAREMAEGEWTASAQLWDPSGLRMSEVMDRANAGETEMAIRFLRFENSDAEVMMEWFDALIGNPDRNLGNYLLDVTSEVIAEPRVILIDHGRTFVPSCFIPELPSWLTTRADFEDMRDRLQHLLDDSALMERLRYLLDEHPSPTMVDPIPEGTTRLQLFRVNVAFVIDLINTQINALPE